MTNRAAAAEASSMSSSRVWHWDDPIAPLRQHLLDGGLLAIPTESSYGLAADPRHPEAVQAIYDLKGRSAGEPLPVVLGELQQAWALGVRPVPELQQLERLWPAPLSVVVPVEQPLAATAGRATLAIRIPAHDRLRNMLRALGFGLTATSANRSGEPPILDPAAMDGWLPGGLAWCVDDEILPGGPPSTLVERRQDHWRVLRPGAFPISNL